MHRNGRHLPWFAVEIQVKLFESPDFARSGAKLVGDQEQCMVATLEGRRKGITCGDYLRLLGESHAGTLPAGRPATRGISINMRITTSRFRRDRAGSTPEPLQAEVGCFTLARAAHASDHWLGGPVKVVKRG